MSFDWLIYLAIGVTLGVIIQVIKIRRERRRAEEKRRQAKESFARLQQAIKESNDDYFAGLEAAIRQDQQRLKEGDKTGDE